MMERSMSLIRIVTMLSTLMMLACVQGLFRSRNQSALSVHNSSTIATGQSKIPSTQLLMLDRQIRDSCPTLMSISVPTQFSIIVVKTLHPFSLTNSTRLKIFHSQTISILFPCLVVRLTSTVMHYPYLPFRRPLPLKVFFQMYRPWARYPRNLPLQA